jgi:hypothetical protein
MEGKAISFSSGKTWLRVWPTASVVGRRHGCGRSDHLFLPVASVFLYSLKGITVAYELTQPNNTREGRRIPWA